MKDGTYKIKGSASTVCRCCCASHCALNVHNVVGTSLGVNLDHKIAEVDVNYPKIYEADFFDTTEISEFESEHMKPSLMLAKQDAFYDMLMALETNFNL